jgi:hypothetical protein
MTQKIRCLPNKLVNDQGKTVRFLLSGYMIKKIMEGGNYFMISMKDQNGNMQDRLGYFEILKVTDKEQMFGGLGGLHKECILKRLDK